MPDITLKDRLGEQQPFSGVDKVMIPSADSTDESPVWVPYTHGEAVSKTVNPDFSTGDMAVDIPSGELVTELTIAKPDTLVPENVAKDVDIAGVVGTHEGGGVGGGITIKDVAEGTLSGVAEDERVLSVKNYAFYNCSQITGVSFANASVVGLGAFMYCSNLNEVYLPNISSVAASCFSSCSQMQVATVGCNSNFYTGLGSGAFNGCSTLKSLQFMYSGSIVAGMVYFNNQYGDSGFQFNRCSALESIHIIGKGTSVGGADKTASCIPGYAFNGCYKLSDVKFTGQLGAYRLAQSEVSKYFEVGESAFLSCSKLSCLSLSFSGKMGVAFGSFAFAYCSKLQDIWLNFYSFTSSGSTWAWLGDSAFFGTPIANSTLTGTFGSIHITKNAYPYLRVASGWIKYSNRMVSY